METRLEILPDLGCRNIGRSMVNGALWLGCRRIEANVEHGRATWTRAALVGPSLLHLNDGILYAWGAERVRNRFAEEGEPVTTVIGDRDVLRAERRKQETK